ncbi:hypothetical protein P9112_007651 [Eukaryota sp. TZLM1-RC]
MTDTENITDPQTQSQIDANTPSIPEMEQSHCVIEDSHYVDDDDEQDEPPCDTLSENSCSSPLGSRNSSISCDSCLIDSPSHISEVTTITQTMQEELSVAPVEDSSPIPTPNPTIKAPLPPWIEYLVRSSSITNTDVPVRPFADIPDDGWDSEEEGYERKVLASDVTHETINHFENEFLLFDMEIDQSIVDCYQGMIGQSSVDDDSKPVTFGFDSESDNSSSEADCDDEVFDQLTTSMLEKLSHEDLEVFSLPIYHKRNQTGFETDRELSLSENEVIAGRYVIIDSLGSAAFSYAIQAQDLTNGEEVCLKVIKNSKDYFDQSLDEIKLLALLNKHDPLDKFNVVKLLDFFYYREHLFLVFELLKENLYEAFKFNKFHEVIEEHRDPYFTLPTIQRIAHQALVALDYCHGLGIIHSDIKPENILIQSYSQVLIKVVDFGSSCFTHDHLSSYVQSRSYRAPEVLLGLPYNTKIDIWSLACVLAELWTGEVLFLNSTIQTLLSRIISIVGPIPKHMIYKSKYGNRYFTSDLWLYERVRTDLGLNEFHCLLPRKSSLSQRLRCTDSHFIDFLQYLFTIDPKERPSAREALDHPFFSVDYEE